MKPRPQIKAVSMAPDTLCAQGVGLRTAAQTGLSIDRASCRAVLSYRHNPRSRIRALSSSVDFLVPVATTFMPRSCSGETMDHDLTLPV